MHGGPGRRFRLVSLLMGLFLVFHLLGPLPRLLPRAEAADPAPLPVPEDPLAANPEGQHPEISVSVDPRDGHLTVRVVDNWGGRGRPRSSTGPTTTRRRQRRSRPRAPGS